MLHQAMWKTLWRAEVTLISCQSGTRGILGQRPFLLVFIALHRAGPCLWLVIREPCSAPVQGAGLCFLTERGPGQWLRSQPALTASPRESRNDLPTASCWEMARTGVLSLPGRQSPAPEKGCSERCVSKDCPPSSHSAMGRGGPFQPLHRSRGEAGSHPGLQPRAIVKSFRQKSLSIPLFSMAKTGLMKASLAVLASVSPFTKWVQRGGPARDAGSGGIPREIARVGRCVYIYNKSKGTDNFFY